MSSRSTSGRAFGNDEWVESFLALNQWARDQVPFPGAAFRQNVDLLIRQNALAKGVIPLGGGDVRLKDIRSPYLNVFCEQDTIVPPRSLEPLTSLVGSADASDLRLQSGHVGLVAGRQAAKVARPAMAERIRRHSDDRLQQDNPDSDGLAPAERGLAGPGTAVTH